MIHIDRQTYRNRRITPFRRPTAPISLAFSCLCARPSAWFTVLVFAFFCFVTHLLVHFLFLFYSFNFSSDYSIIGAPILYNNNNNKLIEVRANIQHTWILKRNRRRANEHWIIEKLLNVDHESENGVSLNDFTGKYCFIFISIVFVIVILLHFHLCE